MAVDVQTSPHVAKTGLPAQQGPRGHACVICRRRKLRCGGEKPACVQCVRGNRTEECVYEDFRQTPTNKLQAQITDLEELIANYEELIAKGGVSGSGTRSGARSNGQGASASSTASLNGAQGSLPPIASKNLPLGGANGSSYTNGHSASSTSHHPSSFTGYSNGSATGHQSYSGHPIDTNFTSQSRTSPVSPADLRSQQSWGPAHQSSSFSSYDASQGSYGPPQPQQSGSAAFLSSNGTAFSTLGVNPRTGGPLLSGAEEHWNTEALPHGVSQQTLLTVFMGHRHQAHFDYVGSRLIHALSSPPSPTQSSAVDPLANNSSASSSNPGSPTTPPRPHPCLINAIYLFASHFSRSTQIAQYDPLFLARARAGMQAAIAAEDRVLDAIQAGCLVSLYLYFKSRVLEGYMLGGAVARLAIAVGLHQIESPFLSAGLSAVSSARSGGSGGSSGRRRKEEEEPQRLMVENPVGITLPEPNSLAELGDRIHTFWQVWCVDKYGIMSTGLGCSLPDDDATPMLRIKTVLPPRTQFFTKGMMGGAELHTLSSVYEESVSSRRPNVRTLTGANEGITSLGYKSVEVFCNAIMLKNYKAELDRAENETHEPLASPTTSVSSLTFLSHVNSTTEQSHPEFSRRYRRLDAAIDRLSAAMPPLSYREDDPSTFSSALAHLDESSPIETRMVFPQLLLLSAKIALYSTVADRDETVYEKRVKTARESVGVLKLIQHYDANYHEVAIAPAWKHVSETLLIHCKRLRRQGEPEENVLVFQKEADAATMAMQRICHLYAATAMKCWDDL
ncbi:hypothetical protein DL93DRAFT_2153382 [Clavulina sp. PMI_390]|nr:hypothetical protein DL93DRAFT_2153382 [Clavulina sp. PMI_390]